jgi:hypothetical protein
MPVCVSLSLVARVRVVVGPVIPGVVVGMGLRSLGVIVRVLVFVSVLVGVIV